MAKHIPHPLYCLCCTKQVTYLIDGKYCSDECREAGFDIEKDDEIFCNNCGTKFNAIYKTSRFCPDCIVARPICVCFYPRVRLNIRKQNEKHRNAYKKVPLAAGPTVHNAKDAKRKKIVKQLKNIYQMSKEEILKFCTIDEINMLARESGYDSYGKYTGALMAQIEIDKRRKEE